MKRASFAVLIGLLIAACWSGAMADSAEEEARMKALTEELRCLVCQNQTIADSDAPLAQDLRKQVREMMRDGASDQEILDFMVQRYGDFVLYRPPMKGATLLLWFGPLLLLVAGLVLLMRVLRNRQQTDATRPLTEEEQSRLNGLLNADSRDERG